MISVVLCKVSQPSLQKRKSYDENFVTAKSARINYGATLIIPTRLDYRFNYLWVGTIQILNICFLINCGSVLLNLAVFSYFYRFAATQPQFTNVCLCSRQEVHRISLAFMIKAYLSQDRRRIRIFHLRNETFDIQINFSKNNFAVYYFVPVHS